MSTAPISQPCSPERAHQSGNAVKHGEAGVVVAGQPGGSSPIRLNHVENGKALDETQRRKDHRMSDQTASDIETTADDRATSRRRLFGRGAGAVAAATVAGVGWSSRASAGNGDALVIGTGNTGSTTTELTGGSTILVEDGTSAGNASVYGVSNTDTRIGVRGDSSGASGRGVSGLSTGNGGAGVYGESNGAPAGTGVIGVSDSASGVVGRSTNGVGVVGEGTEWDLYADQSGRIGMSGIAVGATTPGIAGTLARNTDGSLWYCYAPDRWQRLAGPSTGGGFHPITPVRVFDSRRLTFPDSGVFTPNLQRVISVANGRNGETGAITAPDAVPAGATAVTFNVTAVRTTEPSYLSVVPGDVGATDTSTVNWVGPGETVANASLSRLGGDRQLRVIAGPYGTFHCVIDITGYYL